MTIETLYDDFIKMFPEDNSFFQNLEEDTGVERDTMMLMFSMIVCPYLIKIVHEDQEKAKRAFDFIEQMELSENSDIISIAEVGVLETIMTDDHGNYMERIIPYLGKESLESVKHMSQFYDLNPF